MRIGILGWSGLGSSSKPSPRFLFWSSFQVSLQDSHTSETIASTCRLTASRVARKMKGVCGVYSNFPQSPPKWGSQVGIRPISTLLQSNLPRSKYLPCSTTLWYGQVFPVWESDKQRVVMDYLHFHSTMFAVHIVHPTLATHTCHVLRPPLPERASNSSSRPSHSS